MIAVRRLALATLLLAASAFAQQTVTAPNDRHGAILATKDGLVLPAGEFTAVELIDAVAVFLCRNYLYDHTAVARAGSFTLHKSLALDAIGAEELLHALLATRDLASLPLDEPRGVHEIVSIGTNNHAAVAPATRAPWRTPEEILGRPRFHDLAMTAVELHNADAVALAHGLRAHFTPIGAWRPGTLTACASGPRLLLLHGYRDQLAPVILLVRQIDKATEPPPDSAIAARVAALEREVADLRALLAARTR